MVQKALRDPFDPAMAGVFCPAKQARSAVAAGTCNKRNVALAISSKEA